MKYISKLTKKQEAMMPLWIKKWIDVGLCCEEADFKTFEENIKIAYEKAKIPFPKNIVRVQSPLVGALAASVAEGVWRKKRKGDAVGGAVYDAVGCAVGGAVGGAVGDAVGGAVGDAV